MPPLPEQLVGQDLTTKELALEAWRIAMHSQAVQTAHEARCTERWESARSAWSGIDRRLGEQVADVSYRGKGIYDKIDEMKGTMFKIALGCASGMAGIIITLVIFILQNQIKH